MSSFLPPAFSPYSFPILWPEHTRQSYCPPFPYQSQSSLQLQYLRLSCTVYWLQLLSKFNHFGLYTCDTSFSVPTKIGFYTSKPSLQCSHTPGENDVILGSDQMFTCGAAPCNDSLNWWTHRIPWSRCSHPKCTVAFPKNFFCFDCTTMFHYLPVVAMH